MFLDAEQDVRQTEKKLSSQLHPWKFTGLYCAWGLKYRWLMTMGLQTIKKGLKRSQSTVNQTIGVWQGLAAPFVSSYTEVAEAICSVGLSPLWVRYDANSFPLRWKIQALLKVQVYEAMESSFN